MLEDVRPGRVRGTRVRRQDPDLIVGGPAVTLAVTAVHHVEERDRNDGDPGMVEVRHGLGDRCPRGEAGVIVEMDDDVAAGETRHEVAGQRGPERLLLAMNADGGKLLAQHLTRPVGRGVVEDDDLRGRVLFQHRVERLSQLGLAVSGDQGDCHREVVTTLRHGWAE